MQNVFFLRRVIAPRHAHSPPVLDILSKVDSLQMTKRERFEKRALARSLTHPPSSPAVDAITNVQAHKPVFINPPTLGCRSKVSSITWVMFFRMTCGSASASIPSPVADFDDVGRGGANGWQVRARMLRLSGIFSSAAACENAAVAI